LGKKAEILKGIQKKNKDHIVEEDEMLVGKIVNKFR